jgi:hypothetical protein
MVDLSIAMLNYQRVSQLASLRIGVASQIASSIAREG